MKTLKQKLCRNTRKCTHFVNKKMKKNIYILLATALLFVSCGKVVSEVNPDFIGTWIGTDLTNTYILVIEPDNTARWDRVDGNGDTVTTHLGTAKINDFDKLIIGNLKVKITTYPAYDNQLGEWTCQIENWPMIRQ